MALEQNITETDGWFIGEDKQLEFEVLQEDGATPQDVSGWSLAWAVRKDVFDATALIQKTTGAGIAIVGTYNANRAQNTQRVRVVVDDVDTDPLVGGAYKYALKRTTDGSESVLAFGRLLLLQSAAR